MRKIDFTVNFKKDWSNIELEGVIAIIKNYSYTEGDIFGDYDSHVYSSSSSYALLGYTGLNISFEDIEAEIDHVAIDTNNALILVCLDENENEVLIELEAKDFI